MKIASEYSDLDVLYAVYRKLYDFLGTLLDNEVVKVTPIRDAQYRSFINLVEDITERPENQTIKCFLPPYDDLYSDPALVEEGDIEWQYTISPNMRTSLGHLEELLAKEKMTGVVEPSRLAKELEQAAEARKPAFTVSFVNGQTIMVNKYLLTKPHFNSRNEQIFSYIYKNPNRRITKEELQKNVMSEKRPGEKKIERALRDMGFEDVLLKVFFPHVSISAVFFRNPVRFRDLSNADVTEKEVSNYLVTRVKRKK